MKLEQILKNIFIVFFILAMFFIALQINNIVAAIAYLIILSGLALKMKHFFIGLIVVTFGLRLLCIFIVDPPLTADWKVLYESSQMLIQGDYSFSNSMYFQLHAYQTGLVILNGIFLKVCNSLFFVRFMNCLAQTGIVVIIYQIVRQLFSEKSARVVAVGYSFSLFPMTYVSVLSNAHFSALFICIALYLLLCVKMKNSMVQIGLVGVMMALANAIRPDALVVNVGLIVYFLFQLMQAKEKRKQGCFFLVYLCSYFLVSQGLSTAVALLGINSQGLSNQDVLYTIAVGTGYENQGLYSDDIILRIADYIGQGFTREQANLAVIQENLSIGLVQLFGLAINKVKIFWSGEGVWYSLRYFSDTSPLMYSYIQDLDTGIYSVYILLTLFSGVLMIKKKFSNQQYLIYFILFSSFCAYLILEIATCYSYLTMIFLFMGAAPAINWGIEQIEMRRNAYE